MKRIKLLTLAAVISVAAFAQEKGHYIGISGGLGWGGLNYDYKGASSFGDTKYKLGGNATIDYTYYFHKNWGVSIGAGGSLYRSYVEYTESDPNNAFFQFGGVQIDDSEQALEYQLRARLNDWEEKQTVYMVDIPIMLKYQKRFGKADRHGLYFGIGAKIQLPIKSEYEVVDADFAGANRLTVSGYYENFGGLDLGYDGESLPDHGFGSIHNPNEALGWNGDLEMEGLGVSGIAEFGGLFGLNKRMDLLVGVYFDYGFKDLKKSDVDLFSAPASYLPNANNNIGKGIGYAGMLNSNGVDKISSMAYGVKVGLRIKLGKIEEKDPVEQALANSKATVVYVNDPKQDPEALKTQKNMEKIMRDMLEEQKRANERMVEEQKEMQELLKEVSSQKQQPTTPATSVLAQMQNVSNEPTEVLVNETSAITEKVYFDLNSYTFVSKDIAILSRKIDILKKYPTLKLRIIGNTCDIASDEINMRLGMQRAEAVKDYLVRNGIDANRIITESKGKTNPIVPNTSENNRAINRRCDFEVL